MVPEVYYTGFSRQFRLPKKECSGGYMTDEEDETGRKGRIRNERNYFKTASNIQFRMRKKLVLFFLVLFCAIHISEAQDRWMAGVNGDIGFLDGLRSAIGAETSFYVLNRPHFKLGPGAEILFIKESFRHEDLENKRRYGLYLPVFLRAECDFPLGNLGGFAMLDLGYQFGITAWRDDGWGETIHGKRLCLYRRGFVSPQLGLNLGKQTYVSVGLWISTAYYSKTYPTT